MATMRWTVVAAVLGSAIASSSAAAQVPAQMPVQGFLTSTDGTPVDGENSVTFSLFATETGGTPAFTETQTVQVDGGYFTAYIGDVGTLDLAIFRDNPLVYLEIQVGGDPPMAPRLQMATVPYAAVAQYALAGGGSASGQRAISGNVTGTTVDQMATFEVVAPGPGTMSIFVTGNAFVDCDSTVATSRICSGAAIGICDTTADSTSCDGTFVSVWHEDPDSTTFTNEEHLITLTRSVEITAAGPRRFYLNARGPEDGRQINLSGAHVVAIYTPGPALTINP